jgi:hypothetical protein
MWHHIRADIRTEHVPASLVAERQMVLSFKEELHRLVDEIPDSRPDVARVVFEAVLAVIPDRPDDQFYRSLREVAEAYLREVDRTEASGDMGELPAWVEALRDLRVPGPRDDVDALLRVLESAPDDDEPLTPEEIQMLDERLLEAKTKPLIPHDEVLRRLRS